MDTARIPENTDSGTRIPESTESGKHGFHKHGFRKHGFRKARIPDGFRKTRILEHGFCHDITAAITATTATTSTNHNDWYDRLQFAGGGFAENTCSENT